jgi:signal transduction histidine kinase
MTPSRRLVELHGGELSIESEIGVGTRVTFWFPAAVGAMA